MSYDLVLLVVGQDKPTKINNMSDIKILDEFSNDLAKRYHSIWPYMTGTNGVWYSLVCNDRGIYNAYSICDSDYEAKPESIPLPYWVKSSETIYNLTPLIIYDKYKENFRFIIGQLLDQSPTNTLMFLARYQGGEEEIVCGVLSLQDFWELLDERKILFNVCYIIRK